MMKNRLAVASIALALVGLSACSDSPLEPTTTPTIAKPSFVISDTPPITPVAGQVHVCKVWDGAPGTGPVVTTTANPARVTLTINAANIPALGATCVLVATSSASTEDANPGWAEDHVIVTETPAAGTSFVTAKVFFSGGVQPPENHASTTRNQTFNFFHGAVIVYQNRVDPVGNQGCTPGYWKQSQHFGNWGVPTNSTFASVFGAGLFGGTLLQALELNGGLTNQLYRHGAAAYLNAISDDVDFAYTGAQVIDIVQGDGAYTGLSVEARKNLLAAANEGVGGCPLDRAELPAN